MYKLLSYVLSFIIMFYPMASFSKAENDVKNNPLVSSTSAYFQEELRRCGIETNDSSRVSVITGESSKTAYLITTVLENGIIENSVVVYYNNLGERQDVTASDFEWEPSRTSGSATLHPYNWFAITASGSYNLVSAPWLAIGALCQPNNTSFYVTPNSSTGSLSTLIVHEEYTCAGTQYSLTTHAQYPSNAPYSTTIVLDRQTVQANTIYRAYGNYSTLYGIDPTVGGLFYGNYVSISGTFHGTYFEDSFSF